VSFFLMSRIAPRCCPPIPWLSRFLELNVRTYVIRDGRPGVWFFSLDAESRVARRTFNLPYMDATMALSKDEAGAIEYRSERTHRGESAAAFDASYQIIDRTMLSQYATAFARRAPGLITNFLYFHFSLHDFTLHDFVLSSGTNF